MAARRRKSMPIAAHNPGGRVSDAFLEGGLRATAGRAVVARSVAVGLQINGGRSADNETQMPRYRDALFARCLRPRHSRRGSVPYHPASLENAVYLSPGHLLPPRKLPLLLPNITLTVI